MSDGAFIQHAQEQLIRHVRPYITPLASILTDGTGRHRGSGTFLSLNNSVYVLTCDHVAYEKTKPALAVCRGGSTEAIAATDNYCGAGDVIDVAIVKLEGNTLEVGEKTALPKAALPKTIRRRKASCSLSSASRVSRTYPNSRACLAPGLEHSEYRLCLYLDRRLNYLRASIQSITSRFAARAKR